MRKIFMASFVMAIMMFMATSVTYAQNKIGRYHFKDKYTNVETITVENATVPTENGDYLIELPVKSNLTIAYDAERSQAIVLHSDSPYYEHNPYKTYEECVEAAIKYCLENLIK